MPISISGFPHFATQQNLIQVYSKRPGGFSQDSYLGLNLGIKSGDDIQTVQRNRDLFFKELNINADCLVFPEQIHSDNVSLVSKPGIVQKCDALITDEINLFLTIQTADCFPVFLFDPLSRAVGIIHSGWQGTSKNITEKTISLMEQKLNCSAKNMIAGIAAGVQQPCYQVDDVTASYFAEKYLIADGPGHFKLDVQGNIVDQLLIAGIKPENIQVDKTCTHCAVADYYSYRRDSTHSGRMMGIIGMRGLM